jgi:Cys-rich protein (TIGR01571 family)
MYRITPMPNREVDVKPPPAQPSKWTTNMFDCPAPDEDMPVNEEDEIFGCELLAACPPVMYSRIANHLRGDHKCCSCVTYAFCWLWIGCILASGTRRRLREKYNLPEEPCGDCCAHTGCSPFAVWQEYRELEARQGPYRSGNWGEVQPPAPSAVAPEVQQPHDAPQVQQIQVIASKDEK